MPFPHLSIQELIFLVYSVSETVLLTHFTLTWHNYSSVQTKSGNSSHETRQIQVAVIIELLILAGVAYDNLVLGLGRLLSNWNDKKNDDREDTENQTTLLYYLSWPRFILHSTVLPFNFLSVALVGHRSNVQWLSNINVVYGIAGFSVLLALHGIVDCLGKLTLVLVTKDDGLIHYSGRNGSAASLLSAIGVTVFAIIVGTYMLPEENRIALGGIVMLLLAALPGRYRLLLTNLGEMVFISSQLHVLLGF